MSYLHWANGVFDPERLVDIVLFAELFVDLWVILFSYVKQKSLICGTGRCSYTFWKCSLE